ncbi:MAG: HEAT repeat domain-containing protein [Brevundimonas sp.]|uniref:HEAT repeat domain-containing protein n=1 Tax=Brevundimonas sp. TaxID=1871086 RepID=UPI0024878A40|nr:HEAT repeat domain-containing protein [Brevundimonas sp.]MDI1326177.1 HEAT repeat domain-containing protein [Brevundimonas sp.]
MSGLLLLWWTSISLAAGSLAWISALVIGRLFREQKDARRARDRNRACDAFLDVMNGSGDALGRLRGVDHRARLMGESLLELLAMVRGVERERLITALRSIQLDDRLRRRLFKGRIAGRMVAAEALSIFPGPETVRALRAALDQTRNGNLRVALMRSLIELDAAPPLAQVLQDVHRSRGPESLLYLPLMGRLVNGDTRAALRAFGDPDTPPRARVILAEALGASGDFRALRPLCITTGAPDFELRIASVRGLAAMGHPAAEGRILAALEDPVWMVRSAACEAAGRIGLRTAVPLLITQLSDPVWWVRFRAGEALSALGPTGVRGLQAAATGPGDRPRRAASLALAERGLAMTAA